MTDLPKTREQARQESSKAYFTGLICKQGHIAKRWTVTGNCSECQRERTANWTKNNPEKHLSYRQSDQRRKSTNESAKKHYAKNKVYYIVKDAKRRAQKLLATTIWGQEGVEVFYKKAKELEEMNPGIKYHVDHIVPLAGENVCGLHNQFNLQILTETENKRKGNAWN
jgi:5-methylcytosine-specific restriction endonuclease McrA